MGKLTHLEAFCSDVAKRGRVWTDGTEEFMRDGEELWFRGTISRTAPWTRAGRQVAAMEGTVTWADEPKTLTPQEALRSLADGKCLKLDSLVYRLGTKGTEYWSGGEMPRWWPNDLLIGFLLNRATIAPDPSQPAEPTKPPLKVGDRVKRGPDYPSGLPAHDHAGVVCKLHDDGSCLVSWYDGGVTYPCRYGLDGKYDIEKIEAEPVEPTFKVDDRVQVVSSSMKGGCAGDNVGLAGVVCFVAETGEVRVMFDDDSSSWYKPSDLKHLPAEPRRDWNPLGKYEDMPPDIQADIKSERGWAKHEPVKPPLKVGDRVKMGNSRGSVVWSGSERVHVEFDGVGVPTAHDLVDIEKIEAEPETPAPSFKAGDRVRVVRNSFGACDNTVGALGTVLRFNSTSDIDVRSDLDGISWCFDETDLVLIEAEPQVEYPLSTYEAHEAHKKGFQVACEIGNGSGKPWDMFYAGYRWRIVEPATGGEG